MPTEPSQYRFGPYEVRPRTRELYKEGRKLRLRPQAFHVLLALVENAGEVVSRAELRDRVWASDTFVDFEHGLNTAIKELRAALNDSPTKPKYIETLPKLGYRVIVPVEREAIETNEVKAGTEPAVAEAEQSEAATVGPRSGFRRWILAGVIALCALSAVGIWVQRHYARPEEKPQVARLAVLPLENLTGDSSQDYLSDGLTEEMITQLGRMEPQRLEVIARTSVMHYKHSQEPLERIARELGVQYLLEGSVRRDGDTVRITAQLIRAQDQKRLWSRQYDRQLGGLLNLQTEIAQEIGDEIQGALGQKTKHATPSATPNASAASYEAYDLYLKGRYYWNKRTETGFQQAADYFQQAVEKDPNYAHAYAGLADTFALQSTWEHEPSNEIMPKARAAALKALQIDDTLAEAHASLGLIAEQYDYDWQTAEREFRRAIELDPDYATGHQWYAECLSFQARFAEALAESERARQLDPLSLIIATDHAVILYYARQYDQAIEHFQAVQQMDPSFPRTDLVFYAYLAKGEFSAAQAELENSAHRQRSENSRGTFAARAYLYGRWGRQADAQREFAKFEEAAKLQGGSNEDHPWVRLNLYLSVGRNGDAITVLEQQRTKHSNVLASLKVDPLFDPLRGNPRFQDLLRLAHLSE